jgi:hypothetical protein
VERGKGKMMTVGEVVRGMGKGSDQINLISVVNYLKTSKIAVKVSRSSVTSFGPYVPSYVD